MLRLGLAGIRVAEITYLQIGDLRLGNEPTVEWIGKKARPRKVAVGAASPSWSPRGPVRLVWGT